MTDRRGPITRIVRDLERGDGRAADRLLEAVYDELRALAAARLRREKPGQTLDATSLVHEAYMRLIGPDEVTWNGRGHFFAAAAEAMRRILIERARRRLAKKHGGGLVQVPLTGGLDASADEPENLIALHGALSKFEQVDPAKAQLVKLRYFTGMSEAQAAEALGISRATASRHWAFARAWLFDEMKRPDIVED